MVLDTLEQFPHSSLPYFDLFLGIGELFSPFSMISSHYLKFFWGSIFSTIQHFFNFLPSPPSIIIFLCRLFFTVFWFSSIFSFNFFGTCCHFSSWLAAHKFILTRVFSTLLPWRCNCLIFSAPPLATLLLDVLPLHSVFWNLHCFVVSSPSCAFFIMKLASECLLHHASKYSPYPVQSLCIHWLHMIT